MKQKRTLEDFFAPTSKKKGSNVEITAVAVTAQGGDNNGMSVVVITTEPGPGPATTTETASTPAEAPQATAAAVAGPSGRDAAESTAWDAATLRAHGLNNLELVKGVVQRADGGRSSCLADLLVEPTWKAALQAEFDKPYFKALEKFVAQERLKAGVFPSMDNTFRAFNSCPFHQVRLVILGQDPYHGPGQAMGLCFSVPRGVKVPSSLVNMYKELQSDVGAVPPGHGDLTNWTLQGVLLLNTILTVRESKAGSHAKQGWERLTDATISALSAQRRNIVFVLWGGPAQKKEALIDSKRHHVLKAAHPSGLSAHRGFFGCKHFSQANALLQKSGLPPISWQLEPATPA